MLIFPFNEVKHKLSSIRLHSLAYFSIFAIVDQPTQHSLHATFHNNPVVVAVSLSPTLEGDTTFSFKNQHI